MSDQRIETLLRKAVEGTASQEDYAEMAEKLKADESGRYAELIDAILKEGAEETAYDRDRWNALLARVLAADIDEEMIPHHRRGRGVLKTVILRNRFIRYAAMFILLLGAGTYLYLDVNRNAGQPVSENAGVQKMDVQPGMDKATLTLSDGTLVALGEGSAILNDHGVPIRKSSGELVYGSSDIVAMNTMSTPRGGQYKLVLPDGSKVWLNAASSITFPTAFRDSTRTVSITGEVYLEVTPDPARPFTIKTSSENITVLGTQLNINSYEDESYTKTTLVEGLISINNTVVRPGEIYWNHKVEKADIDQVIAWKNGLFNFHKMQLAAALRQIARWYDIEIAYEGKVPDLLIFGEMGRDLTLSQVLEILGDMNVRYQMEGRRLIIRS